MPKSVSRLATQPLYFTILFQADGRRKQQGETADDAPEFPRLRQDEQSHARPISPGHALHTSQRHSHAVYTQRDIRLFSKREFYYFAILYR